MAVSCSSALVASLSSLSVSSAASPSGSQWKPAVGPFSGHGVISNTGFSNVRSSAALRTVIAYATGDVIEASTSDATTEEATPAITAMLSAAELLKRNAKKAELRRKRLVRKRETEEERQMASFQNGEAKERLARFFLFSHSLQLSFNVNFLCFHT